MAMKTDDLHTSTKCLTHSQGLRYADDITID